MTLLEDVKRMQQQGYADDQIIQTMRDQGIAYKEIADALAQSRIKSAVEQPNEYPEAPQPTEGDQYTAPPSGMERSIMNQQQEQLPAPTPIQGDYQSQAQEYAAPASYGTSPDLVSEIAEQVAAEKFSGIRKQLDKIADMKLTVESKIEYLDERIKKIEKIIDTLQTSVLRKVGDYMNNVQDIKNELIETQKTFGKMVKSDKHAEKTAESKPEHKHSTK